MAKAKAKKETSKPPPSRKKMTIKASARSIEHESSLVALKKDCADSLGNHALIGGIRIRFLAAVSASNSVCFRGLKLMAMSMQMEIRLR